MSTANAHHLVLRPSHPHEAHLIFDLKKRPKGRRANRVRELALLGLGRAPVPVPWSDWSLAPEVDPLRIAVYVSEKDPEDGPILSALEGVHPGHVSDFFKEILAAGLLGHDAKSSASKASDSLESRKNAGSGAVVSGALGVVDPAADSVLPAVSAGKKSSSPAKKLMGLSKLCEG